MTIYVPSIERNPQRPHMTAEYFDAAAAQGKTFLELCRQEQISIHQLKRFGNKENPKAMAKLSLNGRKAGLENSKRTFHPRIKPS